MSTLSSDSKKDEYLDIYLVDNEILPADIVLILPPISNMDAATYLAAEQQLQQPSSSLLSVVHQQDTVPVRVWLHRFCVFSLPFFQMGFKSAMKFGIDRTAAATAVPLWTPSMNTDGNDMAAHSENQSDTSTTMETGTTVEMSSRKLLSWTEIDLSTEPYSTLAWLCFFSTHYSTIARPAVQSYNHLCAHPRHGGLHRGVCALLGRVGCSTHHCHSDGYSNQVSTPASTSDISVLVEENDAPPTTGSSSASYSTNHITTILDVLWELRLVFSFLNAGSTTWKICHDNVWSRIVMCWIEQNVASWQTQLFCAYVHASVHPVMDARGILALAIMKYRLTSLWDQKELWNTNTRWWCRPELFAKMTPRHFAAFILQLKYFGPVDYIRRCAKSMNPQWDSLFTAETMQNLKVTVSSIEDVDELRSACSPGDVPYWVQFLDFTTEKHRRRFLDQQPHLLIVPTVDNENRYTYWSPAFLRIFFHEPPFLLQLLEVETGDTPTTDDNGTVTDAQAQQAKKATHVFQFAKSTLPGGGAIHPSVFPHPTDSTELSLTWCAFTCGYRHFTISVPSYNLQKQTGDSSTCHAFVVDVYMDVYPDRDCYPIITEDKAHCRLYIMDFRYLPEDWPLQTTGPCAFLRDPERNDSEEEDDNKEEEEDPAW